jgi:serine/threonine-protein kinase RsbW
VHGNLDSERLVTIALARIDVRSGAVTLASAGHPPPLVCRPGGRVETVDLSVDPPVGAPRHSGVAGTFQLEPGATLVMFSDGLLDPHADPDDAYRAITELVAGVELSRPDELVRVLSAYARGHLPSDDVVIVAAHRQA